MLLSRPIAVALVCAVFCSLVAFASAAQCRAVASSKCDKGDNVPVTITLYNGTNFYYATVYPKVDDFSMIKLDGSQLIPYADALSMYITVGGYTSPTRIYRQDGKTVGFFVYEVQFDSGSASGLTIADTCSSNKCSLDADLSCVGSTGAKNCGSSSCGDCQAAFYISWSGQDSGGSYMTSSDMVPTKYRTYAFGSFYNDLRR